MSGYIALVCSLKNGHIASPCLGLLCQLFFCAPRDKGWHMCDWNARDWESWPQI